MPDATSTAEAGAAASHAEVDEIWVRDGRVSVNGAVVGRAAGEDATGGERVARTALLTRARGRDAEIVSEAVLRERRFSAALDLSALARTDLPADQVWDLYLRVDGIGDLRLGRHLDDIPKKQEVLVYPAASVRQGAATRRLQPYYTLHDNLSIRPRPARSPEPRPPAADVAREKEAGGRQLRRHERMLLPVASRLHRLALRSAGLSAQRGSRAPGVAPTGRIKVYFLIINAYGMGGTIRTVLNLAGYLARDHDVEVISVVRRRRHPFFPFPPGVNVTSLDDQRAAPSSPRRRLVSLLRGIPSLLVHPDDASYKGSSLWRDVLLVRKLRSLRDGVLITTRPALNLLAAELTPPGVTTVGQEHLNFRAYKPGLAAEINRRYRKLDALAVLSEDDLRAYREALSPGEARIVHIPNAVPELEGDPSPLSDPLVVAAGRLTRQKGFDRLIPAFARVVERHPEWKLRIYGSGEKLKELRRLVFEHELYNNVALMGRTSELGRAFGKASIFALSSRVEGMPMVLLEAMSKRLPIVSFDCPTGPRQLITPGHNGLLVANGDVDTFAAALLELIEDDDKRQRMGDGALETAARYDLEVVGRQWGELLRDLVAERAGAQRATTDGRPSETATLNQV